MATKPQRTISQQTDLSLVRNDHKKTVKSRRNLTGRIISTLVALVVLAVVLRYLPPGPRNAEAHTGSVPVGIMNDDLQPGSLQMSRSVTGESLYLDGVVKNTGTGLVTGATVEVDFHNVEGKVVSSIQKPIAGMTHGGTDLVRNEFAQNPLQPNEMRFFRVAIDPIPPDWNQELPELKVVEVKVP